MRFLFVDRILKLSPGTVTRGIKHVTSEDFYLSKDEGGKFFFTPSFIGETLGQLAAWNVMVTNGFTHRPVAGVVPSVKYHRPAYVGETILLESVIDSLDDQAVRYHSVAYVGKEVIFTIEDALGPLLPMKDFISEEEVKRQFAEINRPGLLGKQAHTLVDNATHLNKQHFHHVMFEFDHILKSTPNIELCAEKKITRVAPYFADHFPYKPVLPLTVLLECKQNLVRQFLKIAHFPHTYHITEMRKIKMSDFIFPGDIVTCFLKVKDLSEEHLVISLRSEIEGKRVCVVEMVLARGFV